MDQRQALNRTPRSGGGIVKPGLTGRTRYTPQYKLVVLAAFESSSLSSPVFARQCGIMEIADFFCRKVTRPLTEVSGEWR
jgi:hypothetical protein